MWRSPEREPLNRTACLEDRRSASCRRRRGWWGTPREPVWIRWMISVGVLHSHSISSLARKPITLTTSTRRSSTCLRSAKKRASVPKQLSRMSSAQPAAIVTWLKSAIRLLKKALRSKKVKKSPSMGLQITVIKLPSGTKMAASSIETQKMGQTTTITIILNRLLIISEREIIRLRLHQVNSRISTQRLRKKVQVV